MQTSPLAFAAPTLSGRRILRLPEVAKLIGADALTIYRMEQAGNFPKRFKINPDGGRFGAVGWDSVEVLKWIDSRMASREGGGADAQAP
jgi:predicted DNA-binding transcriptional regulator AlpA